MPSSKAGIESGIILEFVGINLGIAIYMGRERGYSGDKFESRRVHQDLMRV